VRKAFAFVAAAIVAASSLLLSGLAHAQTAPGGYPTHPVKVIVPFAPGGPTDVTARIVAQKLSELLGQQFYIENQAGAGGNIGMGNAARATPDGYTILFVSSSFVVNPSLYAKVPYDPYKDFIPITNVADAPNLLVVNPSVPATSVKELIALINAHPGTYSIASAGIGTTPHLSGELFKLSSHLDLVQVPFNGAGPAVQSTMAGHTPIAFTSLPPSVPLVKAGKLRALAVSSKTRSAVLPDVPTMEEAGLTGQEADTFQAMLVPAGTPKEIASFLYQQVLKVVAMPDVKQRFAELGFDAVANTPDEFTAQIKAEIAKWGKVIKEANIKVE
jgi:tripartite-type tricarboxylate transporter receptor subunit TctC